MVRKLPPETLHGAQRAIRPSNTRSHQLTAALIAIVVGLIGVGSSACEAVAQSAFGPGMSVHVTPGSTAEGGETLGARKPAWFGWGTVADGEAIGQRCTWYTADLGAVGGVITVKGWTEKGRVLLDWQVVNSAVGLPSSSCWATQQFLVDHEDARALLEAALALRSPAQTAKTSASEAASVKSELQTLHAPSAN